eukprot:COSAG02_NODE_7941_length_2777_cov_2.056385_5_plen_229_part_00
MGELALGLRDFDPCLGDTLLNDASTLTPVRFDDQGRKYNAEGNMVDWWTEEDGAEYERRVEVMVQQASAFEVHGTSLQGKLTCGENIADLGGLRLAYRALKAQPNFDDSVLIGRSQHQHNLLIEYHHPLITFRGRSDSCACVHIVLTWLNGHTGGFTPTQRFFLAWGTAWRQNIGKERALQLVTLDPHGPNEFRCNGPLSNIPEFIEAFGVPEEAPMFKPEGSRVNIW